MDLGKLSELSMRRECLECGKVFKTDEGVSGVTALQKFSDHIVIHQPDGKQWAKAYETIQANRPKKSGEAQ